MIRSLLVSAFMVLACGVGCMSHQNTIYTKYSSHKSPEHGTYIPEEIPTYIDGRFTADQRKEIHQALGEWNYALNGYRLYNVVSDAFELDDLDAVKKIEDTKQGLIILDNTADEALEEFGVGSNVLAWVPDLGSPLVHVVPERIGTRDLKMVVMHEIGHTLGLSHTEASGTLMSSYYEDDADCIDAYTIRTLAGLDASRGRHWDWRHMNACPGA